MESAWRLANGSGVASIDPVVLSLRAHVHSPLFQRHLDSPQLASLISVKGTDENQLQ